MATDNSKPDPEDDETSNPDGAVTSTSIVKLAPDTVKDCSVLAIPVQEEKVDRLLTDAVT